MEQISKYFYSGYLTDHAVSDELTEPVTADADLCLFGLVPVDDAASQDQMIVSGRLIVV